MKPVLKYPGAKWRIAKDIVQLIPEHHSYVEPYFGSGAVFFTKEPSPIELINDLDDNVPNLFRCIKDHPEELARIVATTPYARYEYEKAFEDIKAEENPLQKARTPETLTAAILEDSAVAAIIPPAMAL